MATFIPYQFPTVQPQPFPQNNTINEKQSRRTKTDKKGQTDVD